MSPLSPLQAHDSDSLIASWNARCERWRGLMVAAQAGDNPPYQQLLREIGDWLRRYYERRLPYPAAEDARQDALLAIHASRSDYAPTKPFGPWLAAIARYKWIDHVRKEARHAALPLSDELAIDDDVDPLSAASIDELIKQLKPTQASVIRLVKLQGVSVKDASHATGQSAALVKVNIHRGLKKLAALATNDGAKMLDHTKHPHGGT